MDRGQTMGGQIVGGLLGWALDRQGDDDLQPARLTVDLLRPVPFAPLSIETSIQREGRRIKLADAALLQNGQVVARASALFLRRSAEPEGQVWSAPAAMPPMPANSEILEAEMPLASGPPALTPIRHCRHASARVGAPGCAEVRVDAHVSSDGGRTPTHAVHPGGRCRRRHQLVDALGTAGLRHINADYTVAMSRLPEGEYIGLAAQSYYGNDGAGPGRPPCSIARALSERGPY